MHLHGLHHVTAITARARDNHDFYTRRLGLRLVKKTVNQDDVSAYHLFYADGVGSPGTDLTFFDWPAPAERHGSNSITRTGLRVDAQCLPWWEEHLAKNAIRHGAIATRDDRPVLDFEDPEGQRLSLVGESPEGSVHPWPDSPVPEGCQIRGLGPVHLSVPRLAPTARFLQEVLGLVPTRSYPGAEGGVVTVFTMGGTSGPAGELHVAEEPGQPMARQGAGGVHHLALRTNLADYAAWAERLDDSGLRHSGPVDRYYFRSLYIREPNGILFEIATDEPGFTADEPAENLGRTLALPPFLEARRREIEAGLAPL